MRTVGYMLPALISGSVIVSVVLGLPTLGPVLLEAILAEDTGAASPIIGGEPADVHEIVSAYAAKLQESDLPKLLFHADPGAILPPPMLEMIKLSYMNLKIVDIGQGIHFLQEDNPHLIGEEIAAWYKEL